MITALQVWNEELAQVAQTYSEMCIFEHNGDRVSQQSTFQTVGENLAASINTNNAAQYVDFITSWYNEVADYDYEANSCTSVCGDYTQVKYCCNQNMQ